MPARRLSDFEVRQMRLMAASLKHPTAVLARRFGASMSYTRSIVAGRSRVAAGGPITTAALPYERPRVARGHCVWPDKISCWETEILSRRDHFASWLQRGTGVDGDCLIWKGAKNSDGYGSLTIGRVGDRHWIGTHRLAYLLHCGSVGEAHVLHSCDRPSCVEPSHLRLGTHQDNMEDMVSRSRVRSGEDHRDAILSESDVVAMRRLARAGEHYDDIARVFGVSSSGAGNAIRGDAWSHVEEPPVRRTRRFSKVSASERLNIRLLRAAGVRVRAIAEETGRPGWTVRVHSNDVARISGGAS